jgi:hypothetical protein
VFPGGSGDVRPDCGGGERGGDDGPAVREGGGDAAGEAGTTEKEPTMTQPMLQFARTRDRKAAERFRARVMDLLSDGAWHRAKALCVACEGLTDRAVRQIAEASRGTIISSVDGYKLTRFATTDEIDHCERWLVSQARKMLDRAVEIRRARNSGGVAA